MSLFYYFAFFCGYIILIINATHRMPQLACLHDQKSGFFEGPAVIQPIRAI